MRRSGGLMMAVSIVCTGACTVHVGGDVGNVGEEFTNSLSLDAQADWQSGPLPEGSELGPQVIDVGGSGEPPTVEPGGSFRVSVPFSGSGVAGVNVGFGGGSYFFVPAGVGSGSVSVGAQIGSDVCANLGDICHQIQCYEQVVTTSGTFSKAQAMQLVLNCTGGVDCDGNRTYCCNSTGSCGSAVPTPAPIRCASGLTYSLDVCVAMDASTGYYDVSGQQFTFTPTDSASVMAAAQAATNYGVGLCTD